MLRGRPNVRTGESRLKNPIVANLSEIDITEIHFKRPTDDLLSFDEREADPHPYPEVLVVPIPVARVNIPKVLVDIGSAINILFSNTLE